MSRLIDADTLKQNIEIWREQLVDTYGINDEYVKCLGSVIDYIDDAPTEDEPTADVVEVVRCRDCVYRSIYPNSDKQYWCNQWCTKENYENGYCYRGEKDNG